jgi:hypothetical protein
MKHLKTLGAGLVAAAALAALFGAGSVSATVICSTKANPCPAGQAWPINTVIDFSIPPESDVVLKDTSGNELDKCTTSTLKGKITNAGSATETVTWPVEETTWGKCTFTTTTVTLGKLEVHKIAGTSNGTVTSDSAIEWTTSTGAFGSCFYGVAAGTDLGTMTEGSGTGATFHMNAVVTRFGSNFLCPSTTRMTGTYVLTSPSGTTLSVSSS